MSVRTAAGSQRRTVLFAVVALVLAAVAAVAAPSTFGAYTTSVTNQTNTAASAVFGSAATCQSTTNVGSPFFLHPLSETGGTTVTDTSGAGRSGTYRPSPIAYRQPGPCPRDSGTGTGTGTGISINTPVTGTTGTAFLSGPTATQTNPGTFSVSVWFQTGTARGGRLIGFGNGTGTTRSSNADRHLYLTDAGRVVFGVRPNSMRVLSTPAAGYNDNAWHHAVATLSSTTGARLYLDGALVASDPAIISAQSYTGQWRVGWDNVSGWPEAPTSEYYQGRLAWASVHTTVLTPAQVQAIWASGQ